MTNYEKLKLENESLNEFVDRIVLKDYCRECPAEDFCIANELETCEETITAWASKEVE